jgi:hypothetical protein
MHRRIGFVSQRQAVLERVAPADILASLAQGRVLLRAPNLLALAFLKLIDVD